MLIKRVIAISVIFAQFILYTPAFAQVTKPPRSKNTEKTEKSELSQFESTPIEDAKAFKNPDGTLTLEMPNGGTIRLRPVADGKNEIIGGTDPSGNPIDAITLQKMKDYGLVTLEVAGVIMLAEYAGHKALQLGRVVATPQKAGVALRNTVKTGSTVIKKVVTPITIGVLAYDISTINNSEYALAKYMQAIKECRMLVTARDTKSVYQTVLSIIRGQVGESGVIIGANLGGDETLDLVSSGALSDKMREKMRSGLNNMDREDECQHIIRRLKDDAQFVDGLNDLGAKTLINAPDLFVNDNPKSSSPDPDPRIEYFKQRMHLIRIDRDPLNRPRVLTQEERDRLLRSK